MYNKFKKIIIIRERDDLMICEKCGTENKEGTSYCKKCGEDLFADRAEVIKEAPVANEEAAEGQAVEATDEVMETLQATAELKREERVRTSPLAVRMQEKDLKEEKKIKKKIKRGKVWATIAAILAVLLITENATLIYILKTRFGTVPTEEQPQEEVAEVTVPALGPQTLEGEWNYTYRLKKNWDSDTSGDYETVTEIIESNGIAALIDEGANHMSAIIIPGKMVVDGAEVLLGDTPEAFSAWYEEGFVCIQMKGTEQKFFAPGGAEPLVVKIPVSMDAEGNISGGTYTHTYDKVVTEMSMRYEIEITLGK